MTNSSLQTFLVANVVFVFVNATAGAYFAIGLLANGSNLGALAVAVLAHFAFFCVHAEEACKVERELKSRRDDSLPSIETYRSVAS